MENYVAAQLQQLGAAAALGGAAGLVYDVLHKICDFVANRKSGFAAFLFTPKEDTP